MTFETEIQYRYREGQTQAILDSACVEIIERPSFPFGQKLLSQAMMTPQIEFEFMQKKAGKTWDRVVSQLREISLDSLTDDRTFIILKALHIACNADNKSISEVNIDPMYQQIPEELQGLFTYYKLGSCEEIVDKGSKQAAMNVLRLVQGEVPLLRYRRDLAEGRIQIKPAAFNGEVGSLPTKVPNVDLRLFYPVRQPLPILSLVIKPF